MDRGKGFAEANYARLLDSAHRELGGAIVLVWDDLAGEVPSALRTLLRSGRA